MNSTKQQFVKFLKDNNVYEQYMFNFKEHRIKRKEYVPQIYYTAKDFFLKCYYKDFLMHAFMWRYTSEGFLYWEDMNRKWKRIDAYS